MSLKVIDPGFWTTVQDAGRAGYREWGVPLGGAFDRASAALANALVGNDLDAAVLELTLRGGTFKAMVNLGMALAGVPIETSVIRPDGHQRPLRIPSSFSLHASDRLLLGRMTQGARAYLAVKHGFETVPRLGSRSAEEPLRKGDILPARSSTHPTRYLAEPLWCEPISRPIRIIAGPDAPLRAELDFWKQATFRVGSKSNRMGLRLEGPPPAIANDPDRLSAPVAPGAIQVAGGQLIVLGVACGTMGGYPHIAHIISADLDRVGQLRPGDLIRFEMIDLEVARKLDRANRQTQRTLLARVRSHAHDAVP